MTRLAFLSAGDAPVVSPLRQARTHPRVTDVSGLGKLELRGRVESVAPAQGESLLRLAPRRALLVTDEPATARERLGAAGLRVYEVTFGLAALEVEGEDLMRRVTELDLAALPAAGAILRGTPAVIERRGAGRFRVFVAQELGQYVAEALADLAEGLER